MAADMTGITTRQTAGGSLRFRAEVYDKAADRRIYETFPTRAAAAAWRRDTQVRLARGEVRAATPTTVLQAWDNWIVLAESGQVRSRGGTSYKPSVLHGYRITFEAFLLPAFGRDKVAALRRVQIQRWVDKLVGEGLAAQTIKNRVTALRVLLKWCVREEMIAANPCDGLDLPSGGSVRDRIASPTEAEALLEAIPDARDRAIMATAFYAGLRRGELMALRWSDIDILERRIEVRQGYDPHTKTFGDPKSAAGKRLGKNAPGIPDVLVPYLRELTHTFPPNMAYPDMLVFGEGRPMLKPFRPAALAKRCREAWGWTYRPNPSGCPHAGHAGWVKAREDALEAIGLHECRHTYASICIAAGVNIKTISTWMGHSSITITLDRYGHLLPGSAAEALGLLNAHLSTNTKEND